MIVSTSAIFFKASSRPATLLISAGNHGIKGSLRVRPVGLPVSNTLFAPIHVQSQFIPLPDPSSASISYPSQQISSQGYISSSGYLSGGVRTLGNWRVPVVSSSQDVEIVSVPVQTQEHRTNLLTVEPSSQSVHLLFKSSSSPLSVQQQHYQAERPTVETARTEEQPHIIRHEVLKPVVQELHETIQPFRHVTQEIKPVVEKISVLVPRGNPSSASSTSSSSLTSSSSSAGYIRPGLSLQSSQLQTGQNLQSTQLEQNRFLFPYPGPFPQFIRPIVASGPYPVSYPITYPQQAAQAVFAQSQQFQQQPIEYREPLITQSSLPFNGYEQKESRERDNEYEQQNDEFEKP